MKINWTEIKRKIWHILWGVFFYCLIRFSYKSFYQLAMVSMLIIGVSIIMMRRKNIKIGIVEYLIKSIGREGEGIEASFYFILSIFLSSIFFDQQTVALSALVLGVCDGLATIFGVHGKNRIYKKKTAEGFGAFFISCFLIVYLSGYGKLIALITGMLLAGVELFTDVNDNMIIPPVFSLILKILG
jgi:dolichol kinase